MRERSGLFDNVKIILITLVTFEHLCNYESIDLFIPYVVFVFVSGFFSIEMKNGRGEKDYKL